MSLGDFQKESFHIAGLGISGLASLRYLLSLGIKPSVSDERMSQESAQAFQRQYGILPTLNTLNDNGQQSIWVVSPGIPPHHPSLLEAKKRGVQFLTDLDIWVHAQESLPQEKRAKVIGVTGTNGKSYVVSLCEHLLKESGISACAASNIGISPLDTLSKNKEVLILELSSFQLLHSKPIPLSLAVILNVTEDHLIYHQNLENYRNSKAKIFQRAEKALVLESSHAPIPKNFSPQIHLSLNEPKQAKDFGFQGSFVMKGKEKILSLESFEFWMKEDKLNMLCAISLALEMGAKPSLIQEALKTFPKIKHRMNVLRSREGVLWVNNSKATNVAASVAAILGLKEKVKRLFVILGGRGKGQDFSKLKEVFLKTPHVFSLLYGEEKERLESLLPKLSLVAKYEHMEECIEFINPKLLKGDALLLAPACSSLDQYQNYEERGESFERLLKQLDLKRQNS